MIPIRILARILHPLSSKTRLVLALTAYMDESGHSADPALHFAGMAGFIAPGLAWDEFEKSWSAILNQFELEWFHMNEFAHFEGPFEGWDEKRRRDLFGQLIGVIKKTRAIPTGAVVSVADFNSLSEGQQPHFATRISWRSNNVLVALAYRHMVMLARRFRWYMPIKVNTELLTRKQRSA